MLSTYLIQCEEGFILQGFQVDLEQTGQVLKQKNPKEGVVKINKVVNHQY